MTYNLHSRKGCVGLTIIPAHLHVVGEEATQADRFMPPSANCVSYSQPWIVIAQNKPSHHPYLPTSSVLPLRRM